MSIFAQLLTFLRETPNALVAYQWDLIHDVDALRQAKLGDQFIWCVRDHGTHLWPVGCDSSYARAVLSQSQGIVALRLVTVTHIEENGNHMGDLARISREDANTLLLPRAVPVEIERGLDSLNRPAPQA